MEDAFCVLMTNCRCCVLKSAIMRICDSHLINLLLKLLSHTMSWYSVKYPIISTSSLLIRLILANIIQIGFNTNQDYILKNKCNKTKAHQNLYADNCLPEHILVEKILVIVILFIVCDMWTPCHLPVSRILMGWVPLMHQALLCSYFPKTTWNLIQLGW